LVEGCLVALEAEAIIPLFLLLRDVGGLGLHDLLGQLLTGHHDLIVGRLLVLRGLLVGLGGVHHLDLVGGAHSRDLGLLGRLRPKEVAHLGCGGWLLVEVPVLELCGGEAEILAVLFGAHDETRVIDVEQ